MLDKPTFGAIGLNFNHSFRVRSGLFENSDQIWTVMDNQYGLSHSLRRAFQYAREYIEAINGPWQFIRNISPFSPSYHRLIDSFRLYAREFSLFPFINKDSVQE